MKGVYRTYPYLISPRETSGDKLSGPPHSSIMQKQILKRKFSCLALGMAFFWMPMIFMACTQEPRPAASHSHATLDNDTRETSLEKEIRIVMEKGISLDDRKKQVPVIERFFARRTTHERARNLAALCYFKTLGTPFSPMDLAEIALVESGGHRLSSHSTSQKGALGVWQLMPTQAKSHGYTPKEMRNDEKCAEAAVRALQSKLALADGNMDKAKKLYCGVGPAADAYLSKLKVVRQALLEELDRTGSKLAANTQESMIQ